MVIQRILVLLVLASLLLGCLDKQYPPYIRNESDKAATVQISYEGRSRPSEGLLAPQSNLGHAESGLIITGIHVAFTNGPTLNADRGRLDEERLRKGLQPFEVWLLTETGISLGTAEDWDRIKTGKK